LCISFPFIFFILINILIELVINRQWGNVGRVVSWLGKGKNNWKLSPLACGNPCVKVLRFPHGGFSIHMNQA
jgi:hypothetical protein